MQKIITLFLFLVAGSMAIAQVKDPVSWKYEAKKKSDNKYEIVITATLPKPWHIYSMKSPEGAGMPTKITFKKNPLIKLSGAIKENGKLQSEYDKNFDLTVKYYSDKVEFIQLVELKGKAKTNIAGSIQYMVCDDERCLPPATKTFDIKLP
ncbi:MAG: cytochrome c-type biosis protein DsbD, protein-disulfide reductase [Chitinophagaceae bacterium]|jgi:thiol:disulfide interchange protein DsbD|nr:cytochrome c-type biosis protein DsbD, protein-disulfide reductase [Chitinophagaceae bacterium]